MVGILVSFWDGLFSGAMLVSGRVLTTTEISTYRRSKLCSFSVPSPNNKVAAELKNKHHKEEYILEVEKTLSITCSTKNG